MSHPRQLVMDLATRPALGRAAFFVASSNVAALSLVDGWRDWPGGRLMILGPEGAGKTHLAHVWAEQSDARILDATTLADQDIPQLAAHGAVVLERLDALPDLAEGDRRAAEQAVFHLYNLMGAEQGRLMLTSRIAPSRILFLTPDLASRLQSVTLVELGAPDDTLLSAVLVKLMADRQLDAPPALIQYLMPRMDRSLRAAEDLVARLDAEALASRKPVTIPLARRVLEQGDDTPLS
ncbi:chromosomal replication initiation ATPase DnaA [Rubricella aquisinus]|uniref:Chromosomal replication initiation ATPase DnaA n=1 Tax=Rubricella aquisinus TaxID=2028108 RepID=A0A840WN26_9RHOB|nr:DnaA/Hda family protein [Rubricella aquisinus]MBB5515991.1 chromosomal replication initiation ATPase DnaA [Rubricella aquisinus]